MSTAGTVTVGTTATEIFQLAFQPGVIVENTGDVTVFLGGESVAASGADTGFPLAAGAVLTIPWSGGEPLYGIVASDTGTVAFLSS